MLEESFTVYLLYESSVHRAFLTVGWSLLGSWAGTPVTMPILHWASFLCLDKLLGGLSGEETAQKGVVTPARRDQSIEDTVLGIDNACPQTPGREEL